MTTLIQPIGRNAELVRKGRKLQVRCFPRACGRYYASGGKLHRTDPSQSKTDTVSGTRVVSRSQGNLRLDMKTAASKEDFLRIMNPRGLQMWISSISATNNGIAIPCTPGGPIRVGRLVHRMGPFYVRYSGNGVRVGDKFNGTKTHSLERRYRIKVPGGTAIKRKGAFIIKRGTRVAFMIEHPGFYDANYRFITHRGLAHELVQVSPGVWNYRKFSTLDLTKLELPEVTIVDVSTVESEATDGRVTASIFSDWEDRVAEADAYFRTEIDHPWGALSWISTGKYYLSRLFYTFDLSSITAGTQATTASLNIYCVDPSIAYGAYGVVNNSPPAVFEGTQVNPLDTTDMAAQGTQFNSYATWAKNDWNTLDLNDDGITYFESAFGGDGKISLLEPTYDVGDTPPDALYGAGASFSEIAAEPGHAAHAPFMEFTLVETAQDPRSQLRIPRNAGFSLDFDINDFIIGRVSHACGV